MPRRFLGGAILAAAGAIIASASASLAATDAERDIYASGAITLTASNAGAGWRTGTIRNANTTTGNVTLAVPSGATLDGTTNGTTVLLPYQRARIVQTGATAYVTDWVERAPIISVIAATSTVASADAILPVGYSKFRIEIAGLVLSNSGGTFGFRLSDNGTSNIKAGAADYNVLRQYTQSSGVGAAQGSDSLGYFASNISDASGAFRTLITAFLYPGGSGQYPTVLAQSYMRDASGNRTLYLIGTDCTGSTSGALGAVNLVRLLPSAGTFTGSITIWGEP